MAGVMFLSPAIGKISPGTSSFANILQSNNFFSLSIISCYSAVVHLEKGLYVEFF